MKPITWLVKLPTDNKEEFILYYNNPEAVEKHINNGDEVVPLFSTEEIAEFIESLDSTLRPHAVASRIRSHLTRKQIEPPEVIPGTMAALSALGISRGAK